MCVHTYVHTYVRTYVRACVHACVCAYVRMYVRMYDVCKYVCMYECICMYTPLMITHTVCRACLWHACCMPWSLLGFPRLCVGIWVLHVATHTHNRDATITVLTATVIQSFATKHIIVVNIFIVYCGTCLCIGILFGSTPYII